ncbi:MAG: hypothetical protein HY225_01580 [Candidatus Vogelbacteria bacterium]|nr:hypothetical protein [Candidatus Vogelbacteria bacterium]
MGANSFWVCFAMFFCPAAVATHSIAFGLVSGFFGLFISDISLTLEKIASELKEFNKNK